MLDAEAVEHLQREAGNRAVAGLIVQRDDKARGGPKTPVKVGGGQQQLWVVRDKTIALGGRLVADLAAFKKSVMTTADADGWTLVLAIHGSEDRLGAQAPPDWQKNAVFYDKSDIEALFAKTRHSSRGATSSGRPGSPWCRARSVRPSRTSCSRA